MAESLIVEFTSAKRELNFSFAERLFKAVIGGSDGFIVPGEPKPIKLDTIIKEFYNNSKGRAICLFVEGANYFIGFSVHSEKKGTTSASLTLDRSQINSEVDKSSTVIGDFIQKCINTYNVLKPHYGRGDWEGILIPHNERPAVPHSVEDVKGNLNHVFWLNFYGAEIVRKVGMERFKTVPYGKLEQLADGGVLLMRGSHPNEYSESRYIEAIRQHLFGKKSFVDKVFRR